MNSSIHSSGLNRALRRSTRPARATGWAAAILLSFFGVAAHAAVIDTATSGNWQGKYGSCGYVLPAQKVFPQVETPILPGASNCDGMTCPNNPGTPLAHGNTYLGGASSDLQDCRGQTATTGFIGNIKYSTRLCSQPPANYVIPQGNLGQGSLITQPQGWIWTCNTNDQRALQFPTDTMGVASCAPLANSCEHAPGTRIASAMDDAAEVLSPNVTQLDPGSAAGLCVDLDFTNVPAAQQNAQYKLTAYFVDFDLRNRLHNVRLLDQSGGPIDNSTIAAFNNGTYISWPLGASLPTTTRTIEVTRGGSLNATLSGLFLDRLDSANCGGPGPAILLVKKTNGAYSPARNDGLAPLVSHPSTVTWTYEVTNTGTTALSNVNVQDSKGMSVVCPKAMLAVNESMTCRATGPSVNVALDPASVPGTCPAGDSKLYENGAGAAGAAPDGTIVTGQSVGHYCNPAVPSITVKKLTNGIDSLQRNSGNAPLLSPGQAVTWSYEVTNTGNITLNNIAVNDDKAGSASCPYTSLLPGASMVCSKSGLAQDVSSSTVYGTCNQTLNTPMYENTGTASGTANGATVQSSYASHYCNPPSTSSGFTVLKTPKNATYSLGQNPSFTIVVTSTGPETAKHVMLTDQLPTLGNLNDWTITSDPTGLCTINVNNVLSCSFGNLANGATRTVTVSTIGLGADASACPGGRPLLNTAIVTSGGVTKTDSGNYLCTPLPPCNLNAGALSFSGRNMTFTVTNSGGTDAVLSQIALNWPAINGKLHAVLFGATVVDTVADIAGTSTTLSGAQLIADAAKRTIKAGTSVLITVQFTANAATDVTLYGGTFDFGNGCSVTLNANLCYLGYPYTSSEARTSTLFNESGVLALLEPTIATAGGTVRLYATDEHAPLLGVRTASKPVSAMPSNPGRVTNPLVGDTAITDPSGRPIFPSLFITDVTGIQDNSSHTSAAYRARDWQYGGTPIPPNDIFGTWKGASVSGTTLTTDADPAVKNNVNFGPGSDTPSGLLTSLGYAAEVRWNVDALRYNGQPLQSGRTYRLQFIVHDGDQNKTGGDVGQACALVKMQ